MKNNPLVINIKKYINTENIEYIINYEDQLIRIFIMLTLIPHIIFAMFMFLAIILDFSFVELDESKYSNIYSAFIFLIVIEPIIIILITYLQYLSLKTNFFIIRKIYSLILFLRSK